MDIDKELKDFGFIIIFIILALMSYSFLGSRVTFYGLLVIFLSMLLSQWTKINSKIKSFTN
jgi:hypothetical protein